MGQEDVKRVLKKSGKWLISNEIAKRAGYSMKSIQSSLRRLVKWGEIKKVEANKVINDPKRLKKRSFPGYAYKIKNFKTMDDFNFKNKSVLVRIDLDSDIVDGELISNEKFDQHAKTISELLNENAKVTIITYQSKYKDSVISLRQHAKILSEKIGKEIRYVNNILSNEALVKIKYLKPGKGIMLKNLINLKEENKNMKGEKHAKSKFVKNLAPLFNYYINDAFSLCHLSTASIVGFPKLLQSCAGRYLEFELDAIQPILDAKQPVVYVLGGKKSDDNFLKFVVENKKVDAVLTCGLFAQLCLQAKDHKFGAQENVLKVNKLKVSGILKNIVKENPNVYLPKDLAISTFGGREDIKIKYFPVFQEVFDIGNETIKEYCKTIKKAKTIFFKGSPGFYHYDEFSRGTRELLKAVSETKAFSIIAGTETVANLRHFDINTENITHKTLASETLINFIMGKELPGIEALKIG